MRLSRNRFRSANLLDLFRSADPILQQEQELFAAFSSSRGDYSADTAARVRDRICDFVDFARKALMPPERVIVEVKRIAAAAGWNWPLFLHERESEKSDPEQVVQDIVSVCIDRYYS